MEREGVRSKITPRSGLDVTVSNVASSTPTAESTWSRVFMCSQESFYSIPLERRLWNNPRPPLPTPFPSGGALSDKVVRV